MKRELKGICLVIYRILIWCCSPNPYEEGTERPDKTFTLLFVPRCSPNPYEEGTERGILLLSAFLSFPLQPKSLWRGNWKSYSLHGYRKEWIIAAAQIPMKRELKGRCRFHIDAYCLAAAQIPMKRELKDYRASCGYVILSSAAAQIPMKRELKGRYSRCGSGRR